MLNSVLQRVVVFDSGSQEGKHDKEHKKRKHEEDKHKVRRPKCASDAFVCVGTRGQARALRSLVAQDKKHHKSHKEHKERSEHKEKQLDTKDESQRCHPVLCLDPRSLPSPLHVSAQGGKVQKALHD